MLLPLEIVDMVKSSVNMVNPFGFQANDGKLFDAVSKKGVTKLRIVSERRIERIAMCYILLTNKVTVLVQGLLS